MTKGSTMIEAMNRRFACKSYDPTKKVSDEDFKVIMEVARLSPSSLGFEPWKFVVLENKRVQEKLAPYAWGAQKSFEGASHVVLILARQPEDMAFDSEYIRYIQQDIQKFPEDMLQQRNAKYKDFQEVDFNLLESDRALFDWTSKQAYIPLANMLTAAALLDIDATPIEGFHQEEMHCILVEEGVYDPKHYKLAIMIAFGYADKEHRPKTRRPMDEVWAWYK